MRRSICLARLRSQSRHGIQPIPQSEIKMARSQLSLLPAFTEPYRRLALRSRKSMPPAHKARSSWSSPRTTVKPADARPPPTNWFRVEKSRCSSHLPVQHRSRVADFANQRSLFLAAER